MSSQDARSKSLVSAKKLFGLKGFEAASVRDIAEHSGTNPASINYHFGSKEELFKVVARDCLQHTERVVGVLDQEPHTFESLRTCLKNFFKLFLQIRTEDEDSYFCINRNIDVLLSLDPQAFEDQIWSIIKNLEKFLLKAQKNKLLRKDVEPQMIARILFSSFSHLLRDENIHCKFGKISTFNDKYRDEYTDKTLLCFLEGSRRV